MRRPAGLALALSLCAVLFLTGCNKLRARNELNKGVRAYKVGQYETAERHFKRAKELDPTLINARLFLATAYANQFVPGSPSEENKRLGDAAIREFEQVLEIDPGNITALSYIASLYYGMGGGEKTLDAVAVNFEKSKEFRRRLIQVDPQNPEHFYSIAVLDWALAHRRNEELRRSLGLPSDKRLADRDRRALAEKNAPLVEEGIEMLQKAVDLNPKYVDAIAYLNLIYRQKADLAETPEERDQYLTLADEMFERQKRLREELQAATPTG